MGLSKLSKKCKRCPYVKTCDHKEMENLMYYPDTIEADKSLNSSSPVMAPVLRETRDINIGGTFITVYKDDIEKELYKSLSVNFINFGGWKYD